MDDAPEATSKKPCCVCDGPGGQHCTKCKSRHYCGKKCQLVDWNEGGHKTLCRQMTAEFQDRLLDELTPEKKPKEAGHPTATATDTTLNDDKSAWRVKCAICLDVMPNEDGAQMFHSCCCKKICTGCSNKCEYDDRCPLCRAPIPNSAAESLRQVQKHADKGNAEAQSVLGCMYTIGDKGLKKRFKRAFQLHKLAAAQGHAQAQNALGNFCQSGHGIKIDSKAAALWNFDNGMGVAQSHAEAAKWYRLAVAQGYTDALSNRWSYANGIGAPQDRVEGLEALRLFKRAAAKGDAGAAGYTDALFNLGWCYVNGRGPPQDLHEALRLLKRAAAQGDAGAAVEAKRLEAHLAAARGR
ncbi:hypothetical protein M885DRAFT_609817 [Pelagophyceae sp. CCMP2097]|nr:hypothetical protein M885DRAFT_609817 [Pelagophyceae sp. CCMP2097]